MIRRTLPTPPRSILVCAAAATMALAGCSGGQSSSEPVAATSAPAASSAPATSAAPASSAPATTTSTGSGSGDTGGGKPSKAAIVAGLTSFYENKQHVASGKAKKFATCMVDHMYDKAKTVTLEAMRDGEPSRLAKSDANLLGQSAVACQSALA